jgi:hypothetical protein
MATKWNLDKEKIILQEVEKSPEHLRDAFYRASLKIDKTAHAICTHYYSKMTNNKKT